MQLKYNTPSSNSADLKKTETTIFPNEALRNELVSREINLERTLYATTDYYPSDGELLGLASIVYADVKVLTESFTQTQVEEERKTRLPEIAWRFMKNPENEQLAWQCILCVYDSSSKHAAAIYVHKHQPHLVIAFKGTQVMDDWKEDLSEIAYNNVKKDSQYSAAREWIVKNLLPLLNHSDLSGKYSVSLTGHSLGGWLANGILKDCEEAGFHFHLVTADNPGPYPILKKLQNDVAADVAIADSDRTIYLSEVDLINSAHRHVPVTRRLFPQLKEGFESKWRFHTAEAHNMVLLLEEFDEHGEPKQYADVLNWPTLTPPANLAVEAKSSTWGTFLKAAITYTTNSTTNLGFDAYRGYFAEVRSEFAKIKTIRSVETNNTIDKRLRFQDTSHLDNNAYLECSIRYKTRMPDAHLRSIAVLNNEEKKALKLMLESITFLPGFLNMFWGNYGLNTNLLAGCEIRENHSYEGALVMEMTVADPKNYLKIINFIKHASAEFSRKKSSLLQEMMANMRGFIQSQFQSTAQANEKLTQLSSVIQSLEENVQDEMAQLRTQLEEQQSLRNQYEENVKNLENRINTLETQSATLVEVKSEINLTLREISDKKSYEGMTVHTVMDLKTDNELRKLNEISSDSEEEKEDEDREAMNKALQAAIEKGSNVNATFKKETLEETYKDIRDSMTPEERAQREKILEETRQRKIQEQRDRKSQKAMKKAGMYAISTADTSNATSKPGGTGNTINDFNV